VPERVAAVVEAIRTGGLVIVPTDTVYGLACTAFEEEAARRLYALKGRAEIQPTAVVAASVPVLLDLVPEAGDAQRVVVEALLPGPWTLVLPNPAQRFPWLNRTRPDAIGVRVPALAGAAKAVLDGAVAVVATSANLPGGPDPRAVEDVPRALLEGVQAVLDVGPLPGVPSTVVDLTGDTPVVLRSGAVPAEQALARIAAALG
jgi:L-threonylcarbamoyladenylate synthase